jgi:photosystem II stability/assembly factor-like uncharacterized protein
MSDPLDQELAQLRDRLQADAARSADSINTLAAVKDGTVIGLTPQPPARRNGRIVAAVAAAGLVAASVIAIALTRGDGDADIVPVTEPTTATTAAPTTAPVVVPTPTVPSTTVAPTTVAPTTTAPVPLSIDLIAEVQFLDALHGVLIGQPTGTATSESYASTDGVSWHLVHSPEAPIGLKFADAQNGWLIGSSHAWSTHDGGTTFAQVAAPIASLDGDPPAMLVHDGFVYAVGFDQTSASPGFRVYRSPVDHDDFRDTGLAFSPGAGPVANFSLAASGDSVFVIYNDRVVTGSGRIVGGVADPTWTPPAADQGGPMSVTAAGTGPVYAYGQTGIWIGTEVANVAFVSDDAGANFRSVTLPPNAPTDPVTLTAVDAQTVVASMPDGVYASADEGATWTKRSTPPAQSVVTFDSPTMATAVVNNGTTAQLWTSTDGARTWRQVI